MFIDRLVRSAPGASPAVRLIAGSVIVALAISLGMVGILRLLDMAVNPALPSAVAAVGAALFAARVRLEQGERR